MEMLQAMMLEPKIIIMDETDSGLDVDALKVVGESAKKLLTPDTAVILITHYFRILEYLTPHVVYVLKEGQMVASGGAPLAEQIEETGFDGIGEEFEVCNKSPEFAQLRERNCANSGDMGWQYERTRLLPAMPRSGIHSTRRVDFEFGE